MLNPIKISTMLVLSTILSLPASSLRGQEKHLPLGDYEVDEITRQEAVSVLHGPKPEVEIPTSHPDAQWFPQAGMGLFLHWGIHSVPGIDPSWAMVKNCSWHPAGRYEKYEQDHSQYYVLAQQFNPQYYDPDKWLGAAKKAGFTYVVLTTKHHDGFALWPSKFGNLNTTTYLGSRDLLQPYVDACRKHGLKVGFYFSPRDWHYPGFPWSFDIKQSNAKPSSVSKEEWQKRFEQFYAYTLGQLRELLTRYGKIDLIWFDGVEWPGVDTGAQQTIAWVRQLQPGIVVNPRWEGVGDYATTECQRGKPDGYQPGMWWEACDIWASGHWGYSVDEQFRPLSWVFDRLVNCRQWGGNFLCNVGPRPDGKLQEPFYRYAEELAGWMAHSRESLIGAGPSPGADKANVPITTGEGIWYLHVLPDHKESVELRTETKPKMVRLLRTKSLLFCRENEGNYVIQIPAEQRTPLDDVIAVHW